MCFDEGTLMAYVEDGLSAPDKRRVSKHLEHCPQCRRVLANLEDLTKMVDQGLESYAAKFDQSMPDTHVAWQKMQVRLHRPKPQWFQRPWLTVAAMTAVVCITFGIGLGHHQLEIGKNVEGDMVGDNSLVKPISQQLAHTEGQTLARKSGAPTPGGQETIQQKGPISAKQPETKAVPSKDSGLIDTQSTTDEIRMVLDSIPATERGASATVESTRMLSVPSVTLGTVSSAKFVQDGDGIRSLKKEEIEQVISWLESAQCEMPSEEPPPTQELRIDLTDGRQLVIGNPQGDTVLVSGLRDPGSIRLTSPELSAFLRVLTGEEPVSSEPVDGAVTAYPSQPVSSLPEDGVVSDDSLQN